ncbi:glycosyltransferase family A protein [Niastella sp. OAS944]|uniref:glycosyltransferase family A protein n=1 Tax=Niastella sp. OAS944 TaxID=2664089 RepID=UPI00347F1949|nr:glycosyltransferase involved in cell wall biosynthesis [Chitinophagaceae bacterium OAS944]
MSTILHKMIVLVPFRNARSFIVDCVNSIFSQVYTNYEIYLLDDDSTDGTLEELDKEYTCLHQLRNKQHIGPLATIYRSLTTLPVNDEDIIVIVNGDDYIFGEYAFQLLNAKYNEPNVLLTYGQFITNFGFMGNFMPYTPQEFLDIRKARWNALHLKTFKYKLFKKFLSIDSECNSLKDDDGSFFMMESDMALMLPLLEIAGFKNAYCFPNVLYCYRHHHSDGAEALEETNTQTLTRNCIRSKPSLTNIPGLYESN